MKKRSLLLIAVILIVPLVALTWAVLRIAENEHVVIEQQFRELLEERLQDVNSNITTFFAAAERNLADITALDDFELSRLRRITRTEPQLLQLFVLSPEGQLTYPDPSETQGPLSGNERMFLIEAAKMFTGQDLKEAVIRNEQASLDNTGNVVAPSETMAEAQRAGRSVLPQASAPKRTPNYNSSRSQLADSVTQEVVQDAYQQTPVQNMEQFNESSGWFVWYWDRGVNLIYWQRRPSGFIVGCALERARWMADLIAQLPDTAEPGSTASRTLETRIRLVNAAGNSVYQWGTFEPEQFSKPFCEIAVAAPLSPWRLQCFAPTDQLAAGTGNNMQLSLMAVLFAVATVLTVSTFLFVREYSRDMLEASQQVSFVNQVSHELKTPLTNIRMYAELLEQDLDNVESADTKKPRQRLDVILSEGQRLSRLIGNVLTFARQKRKTLQVQRRQVQPCRLIHQVVDRFRPAFAEQQINIQLNCNDEGAFALDPDFLEQVLGNLISNVEKHAAGGSLLSISALTHGDILTIDVRDAGPGIAAAKKDAVFEPFARVCNDISYAAGTGIGLSIARELAQLHGGDLVLMESSSGCWFRATLMNRGYRSTTAQLKKTKIPLYGNHH